MIMDEEPFIENNSVKKAIGIMCVCALFVCGFSGYLWIFHGNRKSYVLDQILTAPHKLLHIRISKKDPDTGKRRLFILDKIIISFLESNGVIKERRLMLEDYEEIFDWIKEETPLAPQFAESLFWPETLVKISLYIRPVDLLETDKEEVYQTLECSSEGYLFRVSCSDDTKKNRNWLYYHNGFLLKALRKRFLNIDD